MTLKEVKLVTDLYIEDRQREVNITKANLYNSAYLNALFIGKMLGGKSIPSLEELFPDLTGATQDEQENKIDNSWIIIKERMIDFANEANKRRK